MVCPQETSSLPLPPPGACAPAREPRFRMRCACRVVFLCATQTKSTTHNPRFDSASDQQVALNTSFLLHQHFFFVVVSFPFHPPEFLSSGPNEGCTPSELGCLCELPGGQVGGSNTAQLLRLSTTITRSTHTGKPDAMSSPPSSSVSPNLLP